MVIALKGNPEGALCLANLIEDNEEFKQDVSLIVSLREFAESLYKINVFIR
jgi:hypothetical protein